MERWAEDSGNAALMGRELPPDEVLAADQRIRAWAGELKKAGLEGGMDELRARAYLDLLLGKTSDAVKLSSCPGKFSGGGEGGGFVVVLAGGQAVPKAAEEAAEQVALGGGVPVAGVFPPVVVGAGAG